MPTPSNTKLSFETLEDRNMLNGTGPSLDATFSPSSDAALVANQTPSQPPIDLSNLETSMGTNKSFVPTDILDPVYQEYRVDPVKQDLTPLNPNEYQITPASNVDFDVVMEQYPFVIEKMADLYPDAISASYNHLHEIDVNGKKILLFDYTYNDDAQVAVAADLITGEVTPLKQLIEECDTTNYNEIRMLETEDNPPTVAVNSKTGEAIITTNVAVTLKNADGSYCDSYYPASVRFSIPPQEQPVDEPPETPEPPRSTPPVDTPPVDIPTNHWTVTPPTPRDVVPNETPTSAPSTPHYGGAIVDTPPREKPQKENKVASCGCECVEEPVIIYTSPCGCETYVYYGGTVRYPTRSQQLNRSQQDSGDVVVEPSKEEQNISIKDLPVEERVAMPFDMKEYAEKVKNNATPEQPEEDPGEDAVNAKAEKETDQSVANKEKDSVTAAAIAALAATTATEEKKSKTGILGRLFNR